MKGIGRHCAQQVIDPKRSVEIDKRMTRVLLTQVVSLRKRATADEDVEIVQAVRLSDFLPASMGRLRLQA